MRVQVRLCDLASATCVWLSVKMSAVVSRSISQSLTLRESCPSNLGLSCSKDVVSFASPCGMQGVCVCLHRCVYGFLIRLGSWMWLEHHSEVSQFICKLHQLHHMCSVGGRFQVGNLFLKLLDFSTNSAKGW